MKRLLVVLVASLIGVLALCSASPVLPHSEPAPDSDACSCHAARAGSAATPRFVDSTGRAEHLTLAPHHIRIVGDADFVERTRAALDLVAERAPTYYAGVIRAIGVIQSVDKGSAAYVWEDPPRFTVGRATSNSSAGVIWYAGVIVHDSWHFKQYSDYRSGHPGMPVPPDVYSGERAELAALAVQRDALQQMGAPQFIVDWVRDVASTDYWDVDDRTW